MALVGLSCRTRLSCQLGLSPTQQLERRWKMQNRLLRLGGESTGCQLVSELTAKGSTRPSPRPWDKILETMSRHVPPLVANVPLTLEKLPWSPGDELAGHVRPVASVAVTAVPSHVPVSLRRKRLASRYDDPSSILAEADKCEVRIGGLAGGDAGSMAATMMKNTRCCSHTSASTRPCRVTSWVAN